MVKKLLWTGVGIFTVLNVGLWFLAPHASAATIAASSSHSVSAIARCKDGTYSYARQHRGACSWHKGVAVWYH